MAWHDLATADGSVAVRVACQRSLAAKCVMEYGSLVVLGLVPAALAVGFTHRWSVRRRFAVSMAGRTPLDETDFASLFPGAEESAIAVREAVATAVPGDGRLMRPLDRIVKDLMADAMDGVNTNEIVAMLERRFSIRIPEARASKVRTVRELVDLVQSLRDGALTVIP